MFGGLSTERLARASASQLHSYIDVTSNINEEGITHGKYRRTAGQDQGVYV